MATALERITARVAPFLDDAGGCDPMPLLTLEEFFDGNDVVGSIWCNVMLGPDMAAGTPTPGQALEVLEEIRDRDDVDDVRVAVTMFDDPDWPFSDQVVIVTDAEPDQVRSWFPAVLAPDEVDPADAEGYEPIGLPIERLIVCWWD